MHKIILALALILSVTNAQLAGLDSNFTSVVIGYGPRSILVVPANVTDADGNQYFDIIRQPIDKPDGQWTLNLINADGTTTQFQNQNNDLVVVNPDGSILSVAANVPSVAGITGADLVGVVDANTQAAITSTYDVNPDETTVTLNQANTDGDNVVNQIFATSSLPAFFLGSYRTQAQNEVTASLTNALVVAAAINASAIANGPQPGNSATNVSVPVGSTVNVPLNLSSFNLDSLNNVSEIVAAYGSQGADVKLLSNVGDDGEDSAAWNVELLAASGNGDAGEWALSWVDAANNGWHVVNNNGQIDVVGNDGSSSNWSQEAGWWANAEGGDLDGAVGAAIEDFVDAVVNNAGEGNNVVINVGAQGLNWTYPAVNGTA